MGFDIRVLEGIFCMDLGKLSRVELRSMWKHEAQNFTQWLARQENLEILGEEIGVDIKLIQPEAKVGSFSLDILAEETNTGNKIIIENQLETTDHTHLGQLITYASGVNAQMIIWIVNDAREEHQRAVEWLNEHTDDNLNFFLVRMELWKIDNSSPAPKFHVLEQPNEWAKAVRSTTSTGELTETKVKQLEFWNQFKEYIKSSGSKLRVQKASPQHWLNISIGTSHAHITLTVNTREEYVGCEVYIDTKSRDPKWIFNELYKSKEAIEAEIGQPIEWKELMDRKVSRILMTRPANLDDEKQWQIYFKWMKEMAEKFHKIFGERINKIALTSEGHN